MSHAPYSVSALPFYEGAHLVQVEVGYPQPDLAKPKPKHNIWIYDRSGSMYSLIQEVIRDLKGFATKLNQGDTLSIAWFSTEDGLYRYILTGHVIGSTTETIVNKMLDANNSAIGLTCFSEVLAETGFVASGLLAMGISECIDLMFFTDGYPVVRNYNRELEAIFKCIGLLAPHLSSVMLVGYGDYYNRDLMAEMAKSFGGVLVHSSRLSDFEAHMAKFVGSSPGVPRIDVALPFDDMQAVFSIENGQIAQYQAVNGVVRIPETVSMLYCLREGK